MTGEPAAPGARDEPGARSAPLRWASVVARVAFAALVVATFAAFFVTQRLKREPPVVQSVQARGFFSPNRDGRFDRAAFSFRLKRDDDVAVTVIEADGDPVRRLVRSRRLAAYRRLSLRWDGRDVDGRMAPDGRYRVRVGLRREGRSVTLPVTVRKDTRPPRPRVLSIGPEDEPRPELLPRPDGQPVRAQIVVPGRRASVLVYRTDVSPARLALEAELPDGARRWTWDGMVDGRRVASGTYLVAVRSRDQAGNVGTSPRRLPPRPGYGVRLGGRGGISVRRLAAAVPTAPVEATRRAAFGVLAGGDRSTWTIRRAGEEGVRSRSARAGTRAIVRPRVPGGKSGLYLFSLRTRTRAVTVPFAVQAVRQRRVLVVLPATTWQGHNQVDDDGDGLPDTLGRGVPVRTEGRILAGGLPPDVAAHTAPLLIALDRAGRRYDLTTDLALARGAGPRLAGHTGVILAGQARWVDAGVQRGLRRFVRAGGRLWITGADSLRRTVRVTPRRAVDPRPATARDLFRTRLRPLVRRPGLVLTNVVDQVALFAGTGGQFPGFTVYEETAALGAGTRLAAAAATQDGRRVIVAARSGRGLVLRTGLPELPIRLREDLELRELVRRVWTLLSRR